jgi:gamma-glutamyltranspeptidase/glutathione hydrolase
MARDGVVLTPEQAYVVEILAGIATSTPECAALFAPGGRLLREGDVFSNPELGDTLERLGRDGADPFYRGDIATAIVDYLAPRGSMLTREDLAAYEVVARTPLRASYRGRDVLLNPPPSAGGILIAFALSLLGRTPGPPTVKQTVDVMDAAQAERTPEFLAGLAEEGFLERFLSTRMGSTTHISVLDVDGWACSVTSSNGEGCGIVIPGTGLHINNMMGEEDLNPLGFHRHPPGRRLPSMMAPTIVLADERPELVLGSGGSNRIRSAILQTIVNVLDRGMSADEAVHAPRAHFEDGIVYAEPGLETEEIEGQDRAIARFRDLNLFFGGVHAVERDPGTGALSGGGDPRRGGASVMA